MNAYRQGKDAAMHGEREDSNPYDEGTADHEEWLDGFYYLEAMEKTRKGRHEWQ